MATNRGRIRPWQRGAVALGAACAVTAVALATAQAPAPSAPPRPLHRIPFAFTTRQPIVPVQVNGQAPVPFVFDTGASIHVIDRDLARRAAVPDGRAVQWYGGGQAAVAAQFVDGIRLEAGGITWDDQRAAVAPLGYPERKHFAGLLGAPILMRYTVRFDFPSHTMELYDPATYTAPAGAVLVPFELQEDLPVLRVMVDAGSGPREARLMFDTGAATSVDLNRPFVERHQLLETMADAKAFDRPAALGGTAPFLYGTARRVTIGTLTFERPRLGLSRATSGSSSRSERDGVLGNDLLKDHVVTVDYRRRTLVIERPGRGQVGTHPPRSSAAPAAPPPRPPAWDRRAPGS